MICDLPILLISAGGDGLPKNFGNNTKFRGILEGHNMFHCHAGLTQGFVHE
jgi:hypothetical protein